MRYVCMPRQHLAFGDKRRMSFEERCYRVYREYRLRAERGLYACDNEEYQRVCKYERYYEALERSRV